MFRMLGKFLTSLFFISLTIPIHAQTSISSLADLNDVRTNLGGNYILTNDIDASSTAGTNGGLGWEPIGTSADPFTGSFDGNGYTITGLTINHPADTDVGLFGSFGGLFGTITDVHLIDVSIAGDERVGGLVGFQDNGEISGCSVTGMITCNGSDGGGLIGNVIIGDVSKCYAVVTMTGKDTLGGLIGGVDQSNISESYAVGSITATGDTNGGLFGTLQDSNVDDCFARVAVGGDVTIGGFAGKETASTTSNCYSIGTVRGTSNVGGFFGTSTGSVINSYWNTETSTQATTTGGGTGLTTEQMTFPFDLSAYQSWDFATIWDSGDATFQNNGYPFHKWQTVRYDIVYSGGSSGTISGESNQTRIPGADGTPVTAVPNYGYNFSQWSDGSTNNPRTDENITGDLLITASFSFIPMNTWMIN